MTPAVTALRKHRIEHRVLTYDHDPATPSFGREAAEALDLDPAAVHKTLVARTDRDLFVVGIVPVDRQLDLKALARAVGAKKTAMATGPDAERATGYLTGGISPIGQRKLLPTVLDEAALELDEIFVSGGRRGLELGLAPGDLVEIVGATVAPIAT